MPSQKKEVAALLERSETLIEEGRLDEALETARRARTLQPKAAEIVCLEGGILGELGRVEEAIASFEEALKLDKNNPEALGALADLLIYGAGDDPDLVERGLELCLRGLKIAKANGDAELLAEFQLLQGIALSGLGAFGAAVEAFGAASTFLQDDPELLQEKGIALFQLWRFDEARKDFEALLQVEPEAPWALHYLGLLAERRGSREEAEALFEKARALAPDEFPEPCALRQEDFDALVEDAVAQLPEKVRKYLSNVAIAVEDLPQESEFARDPDPVAPTVLGVFRGSPLGEKGLFDPWSHFPDSILLFQRNLERACGSREELVDEIAITVLHEVGHFLGLDEDDLRDRDLD